MRPQSISITGRSFYRFRALMDSALNTAVEKMLAVGADEGTVSGQITIKINRHVDAETGEVTVRPSFGFNTTLNVPVKNSEKDEMNEEMILFRDAKGILRILENQISMDDMLEDMENAPNVED